MINCANVIKLKNLQILSFYLSAIIMLTGCFKDITIDEAKEWYKKQPVTYEDHMAAGNEARSKGNNDQALQQFKQAMQKADAEFGPDNLRIATAAEYAAAVEAESGKYPEAEDLYKRSLQIELNSLKPDAPEVIETRKQLAHILIENGKKDEAKQILAETKISNGHN